MVKIYCKNTGTSKEFEEGTYLGDMVQAFEFDKPYDILAAKVNNVAQGLRFKVYHSLDVEFLDYRTYTGRNFYCRSLCFLLFKAVKDLFPESKLTIRRPISKGYYCSVDKGDSSPLTESDVDAVRERMAKIVEDDIPFRRHEARVEDAIKTFTALGAMDKVKLLETCGDVYITYYTLDGTADYYYDELVPSSGYLKTWSVSLYKEGILLRGGDDANGDTDQDCDHDGRQGQADRGGQGAGDLLHDRQPAFVGGAEISVEEQIAHIAQIADEEGII